MDSFLSILETDTADLARVLDMAFALREQRRRGETSAPGGVLAGKSVALLFEKPSLRTRVSMEQAVVELGGHAVVLGQHEVGLGKRESVADVTRVLSGMVDGLAARVFNHEHLEEMREHFRPASGGVSGGVSGGASGGASGGGPVINMLSDRAHPLQALADMMTLMDEWGRDAESLEGKTVAFIGDGNNVARSLCAICGKFGVNFILASPPSYALEQEFADRVMARVPGMNLEMTHDPQLAVQYADAVYTDTWVSMGQEDEKQRRLRAFEGFQIDEALLAQSKNDTIVLHCLPAYRGVEITDGVMDGPASRVFQQAHNRLHAAKGLLAVVFERRGAGSR